MSKIESLLIIGAGLIGGSVGLGLKQNNFCRKLGVIDTNSDNLKLASQHELVDWTADNLTHIDEFKPDIIIVATPTLVTIDIIHQLLKNIDPNVIITDVASTKGDLAKIQAENYIPSHPIAGLETSGFSAAVSNLLEGAKVIITPNEVCSKVNIDIIIKMWESLSSKVVTMDAGLHDKVFAYTSHLPHLVAFSLIATLIDTDIKNEIFNFAGGGLRDYTRVAASDPIMWHDICLSNKQEVLRSLTDFERTIAMLKDSILNADSDQILALFKRSRDAKIMLNSNTMK